MDERHEVVVIGGGLAGLTAAVTAARAGRRVLVVEARHEPGGRARTERHHGFALNQGAHALYRGGHTATMMRRLGIPVRGRTPRQRGGTWILPDGTAPMWAPRRLGLAGPRTVAAMLARRTADAARGQSLADWLDERTDDERARRIVEWAVRTSSYAADTTAIDAGAAMDQLRLAARGVTYLDDGWQQLVDALGTVARAAGVEVRHGRAVSVVDDPTLATVVLADGTRLVTDAIVVAAGGAGHADTLLGGASARLGSWSREARPVQAATLDLALSSLPGGPFSAYGLGTPQYAVVHSATASLAPAAGAVVHCLRYEPDVDDPAVDHRGGLEAVMDRLAPHWRRSVVEARHRRRMVVAHDRPRPGAVGAACPDVRTDDLRRVVFAGDWITRDAMLADAATSSGRRAGEHAARLVTGDTAGTTTSGGARA